MAIRPATYESAAEARFLEGIFVGRSGEVENTTFAFLTPDGRQTIGRAGRSPQHIYADGPAMARAMDAIADRYRPRDIALALPLVADVRLALNVAACDGRPLVVLRDERLGAVLARVAWHEDFAGRFVLARATDDRQLQAVEGLEDGQGIVVVEPDPFGLAGRVLAAAGPETDAAALALVLEVAAGRFSAEEKDTRDHVREGRRRGVHWETRIPVTDPGIPPRGRR